MLTARKIIILLLITASIATAVVVMISSSSRSECFASPSADGTVSDELCASTPLTLPSSIFQSYTYYTARGAAITPVESVTATDLYNDPSTVSSINLEEMIADGSPVSNSTVKNSAAIIHSAIPWANALL